MFIAKGPGVVLDGRSTLITASSRNLIWKNEICRCDDGILLTLEGSTNNWVIDNTAKNCTDGFEVSSLAESSNAFISNKAIGNLIPTEFGIMDFVDKNKDYVEYEPEKYNCIVIDDGYIDDWWEELKK